MTTPFVHDHRIGSCADGPVWVTVEWDGERLSFSGVVGPKNNGNCTGSAGQIVEDVAELIEGPAVGWQPATGWDVQTTRQLVAYWRRWHLNDMRAGSPAQEEWLRSHRPRALAGGERWDYDRTVAELAEAGLHPDPDTGYRYGTKWLHEDVPADVLAWLVRQRVANRVHPWRRDGVPA